MSELLAQFRGQKMDERLRLSVYEGHIEITAEGDPDGVTIRVPLDELGRVETQTILGMTALVIEDAAGIVAATMKMKRSDARRAVKMLDRLQRGN